MTTIYHDLGASDFSQNWNNTGLITSDNNWNGVPSIMGYKTGDVTSATGVDARTILNDTGFTAQLFANQSVTNNSGGVIEVETGTTNPTIGLQGSNSSDYAAIVLHLNATGRENLTFSANIRDLDSSADDAVQQVVVQYRIGSTGNWANVPGGYIADATTGGSATKVTPISVTLPTAADGQGQVQVRILTTNAGGNDELIGIDDLIVTSQPQGGTGEPQPGNFSIGDVSINEGDAGVTNMVFTVTRTGGSAGEATVDFATGNGTATAGSDYVAQSGTLTFADGETSKTITIAINGDTTTEPSEAFVVNLSNATGGANISDAQATGTIVNDDIGGIIKIHDVQGQAFFSPILAAEGITSFNVASSASVTVRSIVTAIDTFGTPQGFYIMEETADWDANNNTSEGIFVRTNGAISGLMVGETVTVTAKVMEFQDFTNLNRTILTDASSIIQSNDSNELPTFIIDGTPGHKIPTSIISDDNPVFTDSTGASGTFDPQNDALDFYETIEGMRVTIKDMYVADGFVGGSDNFVYFNAYSKPNADQSLLNDRGGYTTTGDPQHYPVNTVDPNDDVKYGGSTVHDGATHGDIIELDFGNVGRGGTAGFDQDLTMGDSLGDVSGIIDFDFGVAKLYVTDALDPAKVAELANNTPEQEVTTLTGDDARSLRIATFNVENLSPVGTTFSTNNGVEITTQEKYTRLANHIAINLDAPDILIIEEIQDNNGVTADGVTDASTTWAQLVAAVNAATGKNYQWVDEAPTSSGDVGGAPGGNIRVGFLYNTDRVQLGNLAANATLAERRQYTDRIGDGVRTAGDLIAVDDSGLGINASDWSGTRRAIVGEFNFNGQTIYAFGNHLPSKGGSDDPYEIGQNNSAGTPANGDWALRNTLAQDLWQVQNKASTTTDGRVVSGGDFNEFWYNRPLEVATGYANPDGTANTTGTKYSNLMVDKLAPVDRFSYDFDGRSQALDTILADQQLAAVAEYDVVHINTGYNDRAGAVNPASSDHDPSLVKFDMRSFSEVLKGTAASETIEGFGGDDVITGGAGNDTIDGGEGNDKAVFSGTFGSYTVTRDGDIVTLVGADGTDTVTNVEQFQFSDQTVALDDIAPVETAPVFTSPSSFTVAENGTIVATLTAFDPDANTTLVYSIAGGADANLFDIDAATGQLTFKTAPDFEAPADQGGDNVYDIDVAVSDGGLVGEASLSITVTDVVEAPPRYTLQLLHFSDAEAGLLASQTASKLAALVDAFEGKFLNSLTLASGDLFIPGPFLAAGTDPSLASLVPGNNNPGRVDISIMNAIGVQASAIGNHEFDLGSNVLASAITPGSGYAGALFPYLSANLDFSGDSALNPRYTNTVGVNGLEEASSLNGRIAPSAVITEGGEKIGLVGLTTQVLEQISSPSGTEVKGFPTGPGANGEVNDMDLLAAQIQPVIDDLIAQGVNKIILLSHLQQIQLEQILATKLHGVDIIIAGGSHTRLGDSDDEAVAFPGHSDEFEGEYPIVTSGTDGKTTLIVNTDGEYTYLGRLVVDFDQNGDIILDSVTQNTGINGAYAATDENVADAWETTVDNLDNTAYAEGTRGDAVKDLTDAVQNVITVKDGNVYGYTNVYLEGERSQVRNQETNLGNITADANGDAGRKALGLTSDHAIVSIKNGGGIRAQIGTIVNNPDGTVTKVPDGDGSVSQLDAENALRFDNKLMVFDTTAQGLLNILNSPNALAPNNGGFIQIGGVRFSYDPTKPAGQRVQDIVLINEHDQITAVIADNGVIVAGAPALISVVALNFTANGGDGYVIKANAENFRFLLNDGTLSATVDEALDFTAAGVVPANALGEIQAFQDYMASRYDTPDKAYDVADTAQSGDTRIQNQTAREDTVLQGEHLILGTDAGEVLNGTAGNDVIKGLEGLDSLYGLAGDDVLIGGMGGDKLYGGEGNDTASYEFATKGVYATITKGFGGEAAEDKLFNIENLRGSAFDDRLEGDGRANTLTGLAGNDILMGMAGDDILLGGDGVDYLDGGKGRDIMTGGAGADRFAFLKGDSTKFADTADVITDFVSGVDVIDLALIDANIKNGAATNDEFLFIGADAFTKVAGQLRYEVVGSDAHVMLDWNGDAKTDMLIVLSGVNSLTANDFLL